MKMENKIKRDTVKKLTTKEVKTLNMLTLGYGMLRKASKDSGVQERTIKNIIRSGHGESGNITKLRATILQGISDANVKQLENNTNVAA